MEEDNLVNSSLIESSRENDLDQIDLEKYWLILRRHRRLALTIFCVIPVLALLAAVLQKPIYESTGSLIVKSDQGSSLAGLDVETGELRSVSGQNNPVLTQAEILRSESLALNVIDSLSIRNDKGELIDVEAFQARLKISPVRQTDIVKITYQDTDPKLSANVINTLLKIYSDRSIKNNREVSTKALEFIDSQLPNVENSLNIASNNLREFRDANKILDLNKEAELLTQSIELLDRKYFEVANQRAKAQAGIGVVSEQLSMDAGEASAIAQINESEGIKDVLTNYQEIQSQLEIQRTRYDENHPIISRLRREALALELLLQRRLQNVQNDDLTSLISNDDGASLQIGGVRQDLVRNLLSLEVDQSELDAELKGIESNYTQYRERASTINFAKQTEDELERRVNAARKTYEALLERRQEIQVAQNQLVANAQILSEALVPLEASGPSKRKYLAVGLAAGALLGISSAFFLEMLDRSIKTVKEATSVFDYPLLGVIPEFSGKSSKLKELIKTAKSPGKDKILETPVVFIRDSPRSPISEEFQITLTNIRFLDSRQNLKVVIFTSSVPGEGKSTISANLAASSAYIGRKTIIIDADLRRPTQQRIWGLTSVPGLSEILVGDRTIEEVTHNIMPNLDIITTGTLPPNPLGLLESKQMEEIVNSLTGKYDQILIDTPPMSVVADAKALSRLSNGIILTVRPGVVDYTSALATKRVLQRTRQKVLGIIVNGVKASSDPEGYGYNSYYYYSKETH
jgi:capsular exopolysaccharide synthesis family protein